MIGNSRRILVLGGGRSNLGLVLAAKRMNLFVIVVGQPGNYPCYAMADKVAYADTTDKEHVLEIARINNVSGVVACCSDRPIRTLGYVCDSLHLCGISEQAAILSTDKYLMKKALFEKGVSTAPFFCIHSFADFGSALQKIPFPGMLKAVDLQGGSGIFKVMDKESLHTKCQELKSLSKSSCCLWEEYEEGVALGVEAMVSHGKVVFMLLNGDVVENVEGTKVPVGHYSPVDVSEEIKQKIEKEVEKAISALQLDNCAVNVDLILKEDVPYVVELTGRAGANGLPELIENSFGIDYYKMIIQNALGEKMPKFVIANDSTKVSYSRMLVATGNGIIKVLNYNDNKEVDNVLYFNREEEPVSEFKTSNDCYGQILCHGNSLAECEKIAEQFISTLKIDKV